MRFNLLAHLSNTIFGVLARHLRIHLAHTPLIWGDPGRLHYAANVHLVDAIINLRSGQVFIGEGSFLGHGVMLLTGRHNTVLQGVARHEAVPDSGYDIRIGRGVWVASGAIVIGPCAIGDNSVIGAGAVVTGDIPPDSFMTGVPVQKIRPLRSG
jgi:acetyltransferase-like isoleucine patch superfamily enzyme